MKKAIKIILIIILILAIPTSYFIGYKLGKNKEEKAQTEQNINTTKKDTTTDVAYETGYIRYGTISKIYSTNERTNGKILAENGILSFEVHISDETLIVSKGEKINSSKLKEGDKIRIYHSGSTFQTSPEKLSKILIIEVLEEP